VIIFFFFFLHSVAVKSTSGGFFGFLTSFYTAGFYQGCMTESAWRRGGDQNTCCP
jgi:hypothetical protein